MDLLTWVNRLCSSSLPQKVWSLTKSQHPEVCTQTPMKKPNSLRGLKTEAKLAKKDMAVVKVVAAVEEAALRLKSTETVAGSGWKVGFGWCLIIWYSYYACAKLWDSLICGGKKSKRQNPTKTLGYMQQDGNEIRTAPANRWTSICRLAPLKITSALQLWNLRDVGFPTSLHFHCLDLQLKNKDCL